MFRIGVAKAFDGRFKSIVYKNDVVFELKYHKDKSAANKYTRAFLKAQEAKANSNRPDVELQIIAA